MHQQIKKLLQERATLKTELASMESQANKIPATMPASSTPILEKPLTQVAKPEGMKIFTQASFSDAKRRHRKTANEVERHYICPIQGCDKAYGSEGSLNQHVKLKHPEIYFSKTPRATQAIEPPAKII